MKKTFENLSFSELLEKISDKLSDLSCDELEEIASKILDNSVSYNGDGTFSVSNWNYIYLSKF